MDSAPPPPRAASIIRKRRDARPWGGLALPPGGIAAALRGAWRGAVGGVVAATGGMALTYGWTIRWRPGRLRRRGPPPLGLREVLDLLRQAYAASGGWAVGLAEGEIEVVASPDVDREDRRRGAALAQLASVDGRLHVVRDPDTTFVAVGDFPYGAALALSGGGHPDVLTEAVAAALRRFVAGMRHAEEQDAVPRARIVAGRVARMVAGAQSLDAMARAAVELGAQMTHRATALVLGSGTDARIIAVSGSADRRLGGVQLSPEFAAPAYPLTDGAVVVGAFVVLGPPLDADAPLLDDLSPLLSDLGPRLAAARALHEAERRAIVDPLTGLRNRREFERALDTFGSSRDPATLIYVDLDHFKKLNDTLGHPAGDAALKHVARLLEAAVRDGDLVARIGGEEFAVWLPRTALPAGMEVAERIRRSIAEKPLTWAGSVYPLTASCGIASCPDLVGDVRNLPIAADAALYRAKELGRNRVEKAASAH